MLIFKLKLLRLRLRQQGWHILSTILHGLPVRKSGLFGLGSPSWYIQANSYLINKWHEGNNEMWDLMDS